MLLLLLLLPLSLEPVLASALTVGVVSVVVLPLLVVVCPLLLLSLPLRDPWRPLRLRRRSFNSAADSASAPSHLIDAG